MTMQICSKQFVPSKSIVLLVSLLLAFSLLAQVGFGQAESQCGNNYNPSRLQTAFDMASCNSAMTSACSKAGQSLKSRPCPAACPVQSNYKYDERRGTDCRGDEDKGYYATCSVVVSFDCIKDPNSPGSSEPSIIDKIIDWFKGLFLIDMKIDWEGNVFSPIDRGSAASSTASKTTTETIERTANAVLLITRECKSGGSLPCPKKDEVTKFVQNPIVSSTSPQVYRVEGNSGDKFRITLGAGGESYSADGQVGQDGIGTFVVCSEGKTEETTESTGTCPVSVPVSASAEKNDIKYSANLGCDYAISQACSDASNQISKKCPTSCPSFVSSLETNRVTSCKTREDGASYGKCTLFADLSCDKTSRRLSQCSITIPLTADPVQVTYQPINEDSAPDGESSTTTLSTLTTDESQNMVLSPPGGGAIIVDSQTGALATPEREEQTSFSTFYTDDEQEIRLAYILAEDLAVLGAVAFRTGPDTPTIPLSFVIDTQTNQYVAQVPDEVLKFPAFYIVDKDGQNKAGFLTRKGWFEALGDDAEERQAAVDQEFSDSLPERTECYNQQVNLEEKETVNEVNLGSLGKISNKVVVRKVLGSKETKAVCAGSPCAEDGAQECGTELTTTEGDTVTTCSCSDSKAGAGYTDSSGNPLIISGATGPPILASEDALCDGYCVFSCRKNCASTVCHRSDKDWIFGSCR